MENNLPRTENENSSFISFLNELNSKVPEFDPVGNELITAEDQSESSIPLDNDETDLSKSNKMRNDSFDTENQTNPLAPFPNEAEKKCETNLTEPKQKVSQNEQNTPFMSSFLIELIHSLKGTLASINHFNLVTMDKPNDPEVREYSHRIIAEDIKKIDLVLNSLLNYISINTPIVKSNTLYIILEEVLEANERQIRQKNIKIIKKYEKDLPDTFIHPEQVRFILNSILQYAILSTPPDNNIGFLLKLYDFHDGTVAVETPPENGRRYLDLIIGFNEDKKPVHPSDNPSEIKGNQKEGMADLILKLAKEILEKNHGMMIETHGKKLKTLIDLKFPIERRKVVYYEPIAL
jgi:signal transduction histidine kinase